MKYLNKSVIIRSIAKKTGLTLRDSKNSLAALISTIQNALAEKHGVRLTGFGSFKANHYAARKGHNPQTGKPLTIKAHYSPRFKAGSNLKKIVNK